MTLKRLCTVTHKMLLGQSSKCICGCALARCGVKLLKVTFCKVNINTNSIISKMITYTVL